MPPKKNEPSISGIALAAAEADAAASASAAAAAHTAALEGLPTDMREDVKEWVLKKAAEARSADDVFDDEGNLVPDRVKIQLHDVSEEYLITGGHAVWGKSLTIKEMMEEAEEGGVVPLSSQPRLTLSAMDQISEWMYTIAYYEAGRVSGEDTGNLINAWKTTFINNLKPASGSSDWGNFFDVLVSANFMSIPDLIETFVLSIAEDIHDKRPSEIVAYFAPLKKIDDFKTDHTQDGTPQSKSDVDIIKESYPQGGKPRDSWIDPQNHLNMHADGGESLGDPANPPMIGSRIEWKNDYGELFGGVVDEIQDVSPFRVHVVFDDGERHWEDFRDMKVVVAVDDPAGGTGAGAGTAGTAAPPVTDPTAAPAQTAIERIIDTTGVDEDAAVVALEESGDDVGQAIDLIMSQQDAPSITEEGAGGVPDPVVRVPDPGGVTQVGRQSYQIGR